VFIKFYKSFYRIHAISVKYVQNGQNRSKTLKNPKMGQKRVGSLKMGSKWLFLGNNTPFSLREWSIMGFEVFWGIFGFLGQNRGFYGFSRFL
jgi:hypothetical protein